MFTTSSNDISAIISNALVYGSPQSVSVMKRKLTAIQINEQQTAPPKKSLIGNKQNEHLKQFITILSVVGGLTVKYSMHSSEIIQQLYNSFHFCLPCNNPSILGGTHEPFCSFNWSGDFEISLKVNANVDQKYWVKKSDLYLKN